MDCACSAYDGYDNDDAVSYSERLIKAAKDHRCCECQEFISKHDTFYFCSVFYQDREIRNYKMCTDCHSVTDHFFPNGWLFTNVWDSLKDYLWDGWQKDLPSSCICQLTPIARDKVCDILQEWMNEE